jgi:hypothetical protein
LLQQSLNRLFFMEKTSSGLGLFLHLTKNKLL